MKLGPEHIGQKFKRETFEQIKYFKLLTITSDGEHLLGETNEGKPFYTVVKEDWIPYEEPKKMCVVSPAVLKRGTEIWMSNAIYKTKEDAEKDCDNHFFSWPATQLIDGKEVPVQYLVPEEYK